ncbi:inosine monophosphate dehydrogenase [Plenodomus tracheiphilus IPT5]|uniref:Inosine monophosphate dehydrogenase n=1 Tax=Plenodomus tracheiphilus IPT5 TaxID=1408161 RepID=A0A6A7AVB8_9PLEO|nr:inosine monophosphate dehydrogenase [Plenodomus tracheiphilus IPT5]
MPPIKHHLPWTHSPIIINAPMAGFAGGTLASTVTLAGGVGMIGSLTNMDDLRKELRIASSALASTPVFSSPSSPLLPIGVGFLLFLQKLEDVLSVVAEFKPAVVWLFAANSLDDYAWWTKAIREVSPESRIWIQVGSVTAALQLARSAQPDVLVLQGADAGGHGFEKGAGIVSLVPEVVDTLTQEGFADIALVASGGIVDGRGVAAALALGAQGVVMGTRFLASKEVVVHPKYQAAVLEAVDGGQVTTRSKLFDQLRGPNIWPEMYDGRSLVVRSHKDFVDGVALEEIQRLCGGAVGENSKGFDTGLAGRAAIWAGTGVGLVKDVVGAEEIVGRVRREAAEVLVKASQL